MGRSTVRKGTIQTSREARKRQCFPMRRAGTSQDRAMRTNVFGWTKRSTAACAGLRSGSNVSVMEQGTGPSLCWVLGSPCRKVDTECPPSPQLLREKTTTTNNNNYLTSLISRRPFRRLSSMPSHLIACISFRFGPLLALQEHGKRAKLLVRELFEGKHYRAGGIGARVLKVADKPFVAAPSRALYSQVGPNRSAFSGRRLYIALKFCSKRKTWHLGSNFSIVSWAEFRNSKRSGR